LRSSPPEVSVVLPGVPTSVTAGIGHPLVDFRFSSTFSSTNEVVAHLVCRLPASALTLTDPTLAVLPRAVALLHPFECHRHPSLSFRCPSGYDRRPPPGLTFTSAALSRGQLGPAPLMGFRSLQRSTAQRIRFLSGDFHIPSRCVLRVLALSTP
jgi:hypothetical protein